MKPTKPIVKWPGGKTCLLKHLLPLVPADAACYCEVFGGGAALLLAKPRHSGQAEIYNDVHSDVVNAFRQAKHHHQALIDELQFMSNSRQEMKRFLTSPLPPLTEIQRAASFLHCRMISFGGDGISFGVVRSAGSGSCASREYLESKIKAFAERFNRVAVENLDWLRCLKLYDSPKTFFFIDPPYIGGAQKAYKSWTFEDFRQLRAALNQLAGRWILTCNDSPDLRALFSDCRMLEVSRALGISKPSSGKRRNYAELIISSPNTH